MSISMDNISTLLNTTASQASNSSNGLEKTLNSDLSGATDDELMDVCKEFEAYFLEQVYKEMKKTISIFLMLCLLLPGIALVLCKS